MLIDKSIERERARTWGRLSSSRSLGLPSRPSRSHCSTCPRSRARPATSARRITGTVEAEAMPARLLRSLLRDAVEALLPPGAIEVARAAEESEREGLQALAAALEARP